MQDCEECFARAVIWNSGNRVMQCHGCGAIADTVAFTRSELYELLGELALPPFPDHPEADGWACAPMSEHIIERVEDVTFGRWAKHVPQAAR